ncbi:MAG: 30S ribosomal protein S1 [Candidatus Alcyoniella australis]|nr:30S ribosomal protein S1 [Candidatus Alcyoniella australis]
MEEKDRTQDPSEQTAPETQEAENVSPEQQVEQTTEGDLDESPVSFEELLEMSTVNLKEGEVVPGRVIAIHREMVVIDVGYKSEGAVHMSEFLNSDSDQNVKVGDTVNVLIESQEDDEGNIVLSKEKADKMKIWDKIAKAYDNDEAIEGRIVSRVKGGLAVDIGIRGFLPGSQVDLRPVRNLEALIGKEDRFKILKFNKRRGNIVLSRRALLEKDREELRQKTLAKLEEGEVMDGIVKNITEYGAFIDLGGIDGLLHITDMTWGRISHPSEKLEIGDEIQVRVLKYDEERQRVSLGLKQLSPDPWLSVDDRYQIDDRVTGKVVSLTDYGAFVELEEGIEGLIHVSEMSWTKKVKHPSKVLNVSDEVESVVLDLKKDQRRISLGLKQTEPNPWVVVEDKYPVGTRIVGKIRNITDFGIFVGIEEGIDGLIHISDISWTQRVRHPGEMYKKSQEVEAVVLNIDRENERFSLGVKQLTPDPWSTIPNRYSVRQVVEGEVLNITDFGIFVFLEDGIEGLIHVSELGRKKVEDPNTIAKVGDKIKAEIISIDQGERKIRLSIKSLQEKSEADDVHDYIKRQESGTSSIGDLIKQAAANAETTTEAGEEPAEEAGDEPAEEAGDEPVEEAADEPVEEAKEEPGDEPIEEAADEPVEEAVDEPVEEAKEEPADEPVEEAKEEAADEPVEEAGAEPVEEAVDEPVEETVDEPVEEADDAPVEETDDEEKQDETKTDSADSDDDVEQDDQDKQD